MNNKPASTTCPLCQVNNSCMVQSSNACWCFTASIPKDLLNLVPSDLKNKNCICSKCVQAFKSNPTAFKNNLNKQL